MSTSSYFKGPLEVVRGRDLNLTSEVVCGRDLKSNVQGHLRLFEATVLDLISKRGLAVVGVGVGVASGASGGGDVAERSEAPAGRPRK